MADEQTKPSRKPPSTAAVAVLDILAGVILLVITLQSIRTGVNAVATLITGVAGGLLFVTGSFVLRRTWQTALLACVVNTGIVIFGCIWPIYYMSDKVLFVFVVWLWPIGAVYAVLWLIFAIAAIGSFELLAHRRRTRHSGLEPSERGQSGQVDPELDVTPGWDEAKEPPATEKPPLHKRPPS